MLRQHFSDTALTYTDDEKLIQALWDELEKNYTSPTRFYHTFTHLENLLQQLTKIKPLIADWDTLVFATFYHDIIYNTLKQNNEEKSAALATKRLTAIHYPELKIKHCADLILATKSHHTSNNPDVNFFTDADLSILGADWNTYIAYAGNIRKEYSIYPDLIYNPGRKKVLKHFLEMDRIFKTEFFFSTYEHPARKNLTQELGELDNKC